MGARFHRHLFVCTNRRPGGGGAKPSCGERGGEAVLNRLLRAVASDADLCDKVAVTGTQCLGPCFDGPMAVVYPEGLWYAELGPEDVDELVREHLRAGRPLSRRQYEWGVE